MNWPVRTEKHCCRFQMETCLHCSYGEMLLDQWEQQADTHV